MDIDNIAKQFSYEDTLSVEVTVYKLRNGGNIIRETYTINYSEDDYQWSRTTKPIYVE